MTCPRSHPEKCTCHSNLVLSDCKAYTLNLTPHYTASASPLTGMRGLVPWQGRFSRQYNCLNPISFELLKERPKWLSCLLICVLEIFHPNYSISSCPNPQTWLHCPAQNPSMVTSVSGQNTLITLTYKVLHDQVYAILSALFLLHLSCTPHILGSFRYSNPLTSLSPSQLCLNTYPSPLHLANFLSEPLCFLSLLTGSLSDPISSIIPWCTSGVSTLS